MLQEASPCLPKTRQLTQASLQENRASMPIQGWHFQATLDYRLRLEYELAFCAGVTPF